MTERQVERAKNILFKWGCSTLLIEFERDEIKRIEEILSSIGDISDKIYSHLPDIQKKPLSVEKKIARGLKLCEDRLERINGRIDKYIKEEKIVNEIVNSMEFDMQYILKSKYYKKLGWDVIMAHYPCAMSRRSFFRIHNKAVEVFYSRYIERIKSE